MPNPPFAIGVCLCATLAVCAWVSNAEASIGDFSADASNADDVLLLQLDHSISVSLEPVLSGSSEVAPVNRTLLANVESAAVLKATQDSHPKQAAHTRPPLYSENLTLAETLSEEALSAADKTPRREDGLEREHAANLTQPPRHHSENLVLMVAETLAEDAFVMTKSDRTRNAASFFLWMILLALLGGVVCLASSDWPLNSSNRNSSRDRHSKAGKPEQPYHAGREPAPIGPHGSAASLLPQSGPSQRPSMAPATRWAEEPQRPSTQPRPQHPQPQQLTMRQQPQIAAPPAAMPFPQSFLAPPPVTAAASHQGGPPPPPVICPSLVLPNTEARFMIAIDCLLTPGITSIDITGTSGRNLLKAVLSQQDGQRCLEISSIGCEDDPRAIVIAEPSSDTMKIYKRGREHVGTLEMGRGNFWNLMVNNVQCMVVEAVSMTNLSFKAAAMDGRELATAAKQPSVGGGGSCTGGEVWKLTSQPGTDAVLMASCMLSLILLRSSGTRL